MLKWFAILTVFASMAIGVYGPPRANGISGQPNNSSDNKKQSINADSPKEDTPIRKPEWWLVILGFPTLAFVGWQAWETRNAAKATQKSAENASQQIDLYVNAERARMTMEVGELGRSFTIESENTGKAIAKVTRACGFSVVLPFCEPLPPIPIYLSMKNLNEDCSEWIHTGKRIDIPNNQARYGLLADLSDLKRCEDIRDKKIILWVFGRICYEDGISAKDRKTRFCYKTSVTTT
jgi:hypothetical protein